MVRGQDKEQGAVEAIRKKHDRQQSRNLIPPATNPGFNHNHACTRCGQLHKQDKSSCPAKDSIYHRCHKKGHFKAVCRSKKLVREVLITEDGQDEFLGVIHSETDLLSSIEAPWTTNLELNGRNIEFKIDTGANVTVISEQDYITEHDGPLTQTHQVLSGPSQQKLDICGQFMGNLSNQFQPQNKRSMLFEVFAKPYLTDQPLKLYKLSKKLSLYKPIQLSNNFQNFFKDSAD